MESYKLVLPEHLNHYGYLFGGNLLKWVDELAWIAASREHPGCCFVTVAMDKVEFRRSVRQGTILRFDLRKVRAGTTSVQYQARVFGDNIETGQEEVVFSTHVSFVCLDQRGGKMPLPEANGLK
jgi:acyl-CoA hydrolase